MSRQTEEVLLAVAPETAAAGPHDATAATKAGSGARLGPILVEGLIATAVLALALAVFFWDSVFAGRALLPIDLIFSVDPIWTAIARPDLRIPSNPNLTDVVDQFYPWRAYF